jgi:hypothetical protein
MAKDSFKLQPEDIKDLLPPIGFCLVSNQITVEGMQVGYMYREEPYEYIEKERAREDNDTGWRFLSGFETEEYLDNPGNSKFFSVNVVANYDPAIIPYIKLPIGTELERAEGSNEFVIVS